MSDHQVNMKSGRRDLGDNIFYVYTGDGDGTAPPTSAPTVTPPQREVNYRVCGSSDDVSGVANVHFVYDIESTVELSSEESAAVLEALEHVILDRVYNSTCGDDRRRRQLESAERRLEIETISAGRKDSIQGDCVASSDDANSCKRYDGTIAMGFSNEGENDTKMEAGNAALRVISGDMNQGVYIDALNDALNVTLPNGTVVTSSSTITRVSYVGTSFYDSSANAFSSGSYIVTSGGLSVLGKVFVPMLGVLFVGALAALYLSYQVKRQKQELRKLPVEKNVYHGYGGDDSQSEFTTEDLPADIYHDYTIASIGSWDMYSQQQRPETPKELTPETLAFVKSVEESNSKKRFLNWLPFGKSKQPSGIEFLEEADSCGGQGHEYENDGYGDHDNMDVVSDRESQCEDGVFQDEPQQPTMMYPQVEGCGVVELDTEPCGSVIGQRRDVVDATGCVRGEIEL
eukprot:Nitzschia sp. Nitz4//scaffold28_size193895//179058//180431//NITZ4_001691-RA/size193895-processed-gene-0.286-mRNA-1//-1//CDS//3329546060//5479//frame0